MRGREWLGIWKVASCSGVSRPQDRSYGLSMRGGLRVCVCGLGSECQRHTTEYAVEGLGFLEFGSDNPMLCAGGRRPSRPFGCHRMPPSRTKNAVARVLHPATTHLCLVPHSMDVPNRESGGILAPGAQGHAEPETPKPEKLLKPFNSEPLISKTQRLYILELL